MQARYDKQLTSSKLSITHHIKIKSFSNTN